MLTFRLGPALSMLVLIAPIHAMAATRIVPIHPERDNMSAVDRHDRVLADLNSILTEAATATSIATAPYGAGEAGLCRRDVIQLAYMPEKDGGSDPRFKPIGIHYVFTEYHLLGREKSGNRGDWPKACGRLSGKDVYWARSSNSWAAASALATLGTVVEDVRKGKSVSIDCKELNDAEVESRCAAEFLAAAPKVFSVERCPDQPSECYEFSLGEYQVTIVKTYPQSANGEYRFTVQMKSGPIVVT